jgi:opacity protein-like surface antigen
MKKWTGYALWAIVAFLLLFVPAGNAAAAGSGGYVGVFGGYSIPNDMEVSGGSAGSGDISLENGYVAGLKAGFIPPQMQYFAVELEYFYTSNDIDSQTIGASNVSGDITSNNIFVNAFLRYPVNWFQPYVGLGIGWSWGETSGSGTGALSRILNQTSDDFAWQFLLGADFVINPQWAIDVGYRYVQCSYGFDTGDGDLTNHMFTVGLKYRF